MPQPKQISLSVVKIKNWHESESNNSFELNFSDKSGLIKSSIVHGQKKETDIHLNCHLKIGYSQSQPTVQLQLSHTIGRGGKIILGQFNINLESLRTNKRQLFRFGKKDNQVLLVSLYKSDEGSNQKIIKAAEKIQDLYGLKVSNINTRTDNSDFIKQRQQFLERHSNRSKASSRSSRLRQNFTSKKNLVSPQPNQGDNRASHPTYFDDYNQGPIDELSHSREGYFIQRGQRRSNLEENARSHFQVFRQNSQKDSSVNSRRSSARKCVLIVNNLNVIPCEQYYQNRAKQITQETIRKNDQSKGTHDRYRNSASSDKNTLKSRLKPHNSRNTVNINDVYRGSEYF